MDDQIRMLVKSQIGGDRQQIDSLKTMIDGVTFKYILLPIWMAAYEVQKKKYQVLINGRSGVVMGERPWSWVKITLLVLAIVLVLAAITAVIIANN
jgi:hypothetical protein